MQINIFRAIIGFVVALVIGAGLGYLARPVPDNSGAITDAQNRAVFAEERANDLAGKLVIAQDAIDDARDDAQRATENARRSDAEARRLATVVGQFGRDLETANRNIVESRKQAERGARIINASLERFPIGDRSFEIIESVLGEIEAAGR